MAKKPKTLKEIAIELLEKYEASETTAIWEYSPNIRLSEEMLKKEAAKYRKMIDKADRKTGNSSEKPNNCEECKHWNDTEDGCADRHGCRATTEDCSKVPTSSKMEQVDEPQTCSVNGRPYTDCCNCEYFKCTADEPQTERSE